MSDGGSIVSNLIWRFMERMGAKLVQFLVTVVLARILLPDDFSLVALVVVISQIFFVFVDSGFGNALIQKKDSDDLDFSSVFYFNVALCLVLYSVLFFTAPVISSFFSKPELIPVLRVLGFIIVVSGLKNVQQAYVSKTMQFRKFFFATLTGTIISAVVGIAVAQMGFGVWALVAQRLTNLIVDTLSLWIIVDWKPKLMFSMDRLKVLFKYGWKLSVSALVNSVYSNARTLVIGKFYTDAELGYYNQGEHFPMVIGTNINSSIDSVLFPVMAKHQDDKAKVKEIARNMLKVSLYILAPIMAGLAACSPEIVALVLTEKWLPCVPFFALFCIIYLFYPIHTTNLNVIKAVGRSDIFLTLEIVKCIFDFALLIAMYRYGVMAIAISLLISDVISQIINSFPNKKFIDYGYLEQLKDMSGTILLTAFMAGAVYVLGHLGLGVVLTLILKIVVGVIIYVSASLIFKFEEYHFLMGYIKKFSKGTKKRG